MKTVNFDVSLFGLDGKTLKEREGGEAVNLKKMVANQLISSKSKGDAIRQLEVAKKIYSSSGAIELEDADFKLLEGMEKDAPWAVITQAAFEQAMKLAETKSEKKPKKAA